MSSVINPLGGFAPNSSRLFARASQEPAATVQVHDSSPRLEEETVASKDELSLWFLSYRYRFDFDDLVASIVGNVYGPLVDSVPSADWHWIPRRNTFLTNDKELAYRISRTCSHLNLPFTLQFDTTGVPGESTNTVAP